MRISHRFRTALVAATMLAGVGGLAGVASASAANEMDPSFSGSYLAGRSADRARDISSAARFYANALKADADNPPLMERLLLLGLAAGEMNDSFALAKRLVVIDASNPAGRLALAVQALKQNQPKVATDNLAEIGPADLATLTAGLITAWVEFGDGKVDEAVKTVTGLNGPEWYAIFRDYHTALILDAAGRTTEAAAVIGKAYATDGTALRIVTGYARIMARAGKRDDAIRALVSFGGESPRHPELRYLLADLRAGKALPPLVTTTTTGVAEALYGLGSAIGIDEGPELPATYLRLASYLDVGDYLTTIALGDIFQSVDRCEDALPLYESVPKAAHVRRNADIQAGACLATLKKPDEGAKFIAQVVDADPSDIEAAIELGNIYRADERFAEAAMAYSRGIAALTSPMKPDWRVFYFRGVALERSKQWPEAEADFKRALTINPEQPQVLNYLGYSWVDRGLNLDNALDMIKKAVALAPNDGYIVDSLGWAYFRLGRDQEAVATLENAIELKGGDATINDHLGDAYWKVGRKREAYFQWRHARDSEPEKDQLPLILAKIEHGLDAGLTTADSSITVRPGESLWTIAERVLGDAQQYNRLFEANKDRIGDPNRIFPGMTLEVPSGTVH